MLWTNCFVCVDSDFMQAAGAQAELFFWLTVEGYRVTAQQQLEAMQGWQKDGKKQPSATKGLLKAAALGVYEQYLSDKVGGHAKVKGHFDRILLPHSSYSMVNVPAL